MQSADLGERDDLPGTDGLDRSPVGCVLCQRQVRTRPVIVGEVRRENPPQVHRPHETAGQLRMLIRRALSLVVAILWLWPTGIYAQSEAFWDAIRQGKELKAAGQYEQAVPFYLNALELGEKEFGPDHPTTAIALNNLAFLYDARVATLRLNRSIGAR